MKQAWALKVVGLGKFSLVSSSPFIFLFATAGCEPVGHFRRRQWRGNWGIRIHLLASVVAQERTDLHAGSVQGFLLSVTLVAVERVRKSVQPVILECHGFRRTAGVLCSLKA